MSKELVQLAVHMLDNPNGIDLETYGKLKSAVKAARSSDGKELLENVTIAQDVAFLDETWVEANAERFE